MCKCSCENNTVKSVNASSLKRGLSNSCGCIARECTHELFFLHGESATRLYGIYSGMIDRCFKEYSSSYIKYGGRGIVVCEEWANDFLNFKNWAINNGYDDSLSIDRINVNGNYEPENCRWANNITQANNKTDNKIINIFGISKTVAEWSREYDLHPNLIYSRSKRGIEGEALLLKPKYKKIKPVDSFINNEFYKTFYTYEDIFDELNISKTDVLLAIKRNGNIGNVKFKRSENTERWN